MRSIPLRLGSARVSRAGERVLAIANFVKIPFSAEWRTPKDYFGATPKPARETQALPRFRIEQATHRR
jgi:hypothetical protein